MFKSENNQSCISEKTPLVVGDLTVFPDRLKFNQQKCNFYDVDGLGWNWISTTVGLIKRHDVELKIFFKGERRPISINSSKMFVTPKLVTAYNYIARNTFHKRLNKYTSQLETFGGFKYNNIYIYSDGKVVKNEKVYSLKDAQIEPLEIILYEGGFYFSRCIIETKLDRDVILGLINLIIKNPQNPDKIRESSRRKKEEKKQKPSYITCIIYLLAKVSKADNVVTKEEIKVIKKFFLNDLKLDEKSYKFAINIFRTAKDSPVPIDQHAKVFINNFVYDEPLLIKIVDLLFSVAISDGNFSAEEELMVSEVESIFNVIGKTEFSRYKAKNNRNESESRNDEKKFNEILGLNMDSKPSQIKLTYRRLVMQYHPDRVQHLGIEFQKLAEKKIKEIYMAWEYFQAKYDL